MRLIFAAVLAVAAAVAASPAARAQESDEELKRRILDKVRDRLTEEKKLILERMAKVIDEELAGGAKKEPAPAPSAPKPTDKRIRDLERKLQALDDQRDDLMRDIRAIRRETEDAKIIEGSKGVAKEIEEAVEAQDQDAIQEASRALSDEFKGYNRQHEAKEYDKSIAGFKKLYYGLRNSRIKQIAVSTGAPAAYNVACGYALKGDKVQALDWLDLSIKLGFDQWDHIRQDTDFDSIRKERRFLRLLTDR